jgi:hypothetical protein
MLFTRRFFVGDIWRYEPWLFIISSGFLSNGELFFFEVFSSLRIVDVLFWLIAPGIDVVSLGF